MPVRRGEHPQGPAHRWRAPSFAEQMTAQRQFPAPSNSEGWREPAPTFVPPAGVAQGHVVPEDYVLVAVPRTVLYQLIREENLMNTNASSTSTATTNQPTAEQLRQQQQFVDEHLRREATGRLESTSDAAVVADQGRTSGFRNFGKALWRATAVSAGVAAVAALGLWSYQLYRESRG